MPKRKKHSENSAKRYRWLKELAKLLEDTEQFESPNLSENRLSREHAQTISERSGQADARAYWKQQPAQEAIRAMRAKIAITASTAPKKAERAASANDE